jgi:hypothetical protein
VKTYHPNKPVNRMIREIRRIRMIRMIREMRRIRMIRKMRMIREIRKKVYEVSYPKIGCHKKTTYGTTQTTQSVRSLPARGAKKSCTYVFN